MKNVLLTGLLFIVCIFFSFPGMAQTTGEVQTCGVPQYFSNELIVQILADPDYSLTYNEKLGKTLTARLQEFFVSFNYSALMEDINLTLIPKVKSYLLPVVGNAINWLNQNKGKLFNNVYIDPKRYYQFKCRPNEAYLTMRMYTTPFDQETLKLALALISTGITQHGSFRLATDGYSVGTVTLNWSFTASQPVNMITGGPGGLPMPPRPITGLWPVVLPAEYKLYCDSSCPGLEKALAVASKSSTPVFVLDSVPDLLFATDDKIIGKNELTKELLNSLSTTLSRERYTSGDALFHSYLNEKNGNKNLSDHGLFIAGLIHMLAPESGIRLIEILNSCGSGTLDTLIWGLNRVISSMDGSGKPFVVNLSLTAKLFFPSSGKRTELIEGKMVDNNLDMFVYGIEYPELIFFKPLRSIIRSIDECGGAVVAAAGNDSNANEHYPAGVPACFPEVFSAASSFKDGFLSSFSNLPGPNGYVLYGGEIDRDRLTLEGLLSVYISPFYAGAPTVENVSGWAKWAGTSFSCGVLSGTIAALCNRSFPVGDIELFLNKVAIQRKNLYYPYYPDYLNYLPLKQGS